MTAVAFKQSVYSLCLEALKTRISLAQQALQDLDEASQNETKSSAGDKFETAREMAQQERDRHSQLLLEAKKMEAQLQPLYPEKQHETAQLGSLIFTQAHVFYLAIGLGAVQVEEKPIMVLSPASPIGQKLLGCRVGQTVTHGSHQYQILEIY